MGLAYATPPLDRPVTVNGPVSATLYGSTKSIDTSLWAYFLKVGDMAPDGSVKLVSKGNLKACYRELDESKSSEQWPWHPFTKAEYLEPETVYDFLVQIKPIFHTFQRGTASGCRSQATIPSTSWTTSPILCRVHTRRRTPSTTTSCAHPVSCCR